jgi:hypothetical protein
MILLPGGLDVFYIDESNDSKLYAVTAIAIPFLRNDNGIWRLTWPDALNAAKAWRRRVADRHKIPVSKELHATKLISGRGNYLYGNRQLRKEDAVPIYRDILSSVDFIPPESVITVVGTRGRTMYGHERLQRVMYALFQRMRSQCKARRVNAMTFFDQGHPEYRALFRRAMVNLPTGSRFGEERNLPLDMFVKDGNEKDSKYCLFTQLADLISYAALARLRHEGGLLDPTQEANGVHTLYEGMPEAIKNLRAGGRDGIVRIG